MEFSEILEAIKKTLGFKSNVELAEALGVSQSSISQWKSRNSVGLLFQTLFEYLQNNDIDLDLNNIFFGKNGNTLHSSKDSYESTYNQKKYNEIDLATLELFLEIYREHKDKDSIKELRKKLLEL